MNSRIICPAVGDEHFIVEGIASTRDAAGDPHLAPMGPIVDASFDQLWLRPFRTSTTFANLQRTLCGVFHVVDDVELLARAAIGRIVPHELRFLPPTSFPGDVLADACRWYAFRVEHIDDSAERITLECRVVERGVLQDFLGFQRAKHAVVEAAILATRAGILSAETIQAEMERLAPLVAKTGGAAERRAFAMLQHYLAEQREAPR